MNFFYKVKKAGQNPFILFCPFLILYTLIVIIHPTTLAFGDESRYLIYSHYLLTGELPADVKGEFDLLGNGPGYSLFLVPFVYLKVPSLTIALFNAVFYYLSVVLLFQTLKKYLSFKSSLAFSLFWSCYINMYENLPFVLPEIFATLLVSLFVYFMVLIGQEKRQFCYKILFSSFTLGLLMLTKPIFGYVTLTVLAGIGILTLFKFKKKIYLKILTVLIIALLTNAPYLFTTYFKTGKVFYWSSAGGNNLYWMSNPNQKEYGDWFPDPSTTSFKAIEQDTTFFSPRNHIVANHGKDFDFINRLDINDRDDSFKRLAIENIKKHPVKFLSNCFANAGRILFNFPYSYTFQKPGTLFRLPMTGLLLVLILFSVIPGIMNWRKISFEVRFLTLFCLVYLGGSILGSAETRMFSMVVPILIVWTGIVFTKTVKIRFKWN